MSAVDNGAEPGFDTLEQAAQWFALLRSGDATAQDRQRWQCWLDQRPEHRQAWFYVDAIGQRFEPVRTGVARQVATRALRERGVTRRQLNTGLVVALGALAWTGWRPASTAWAVARADYRGAVGEVRDIALADGSRVWLNTGSALDADYRSSLRRLRLVAGEILIDTAPDPRPFVVETRHGRLRALGTRFTVGALDDGASYLAVYQGAVEVNPAAGPARVVTAGQQVRFDAAGATAPEAADPAREVWARGVLLAEDIPLERLVRELGRYRRGHLGVAPEVAGLRVLGGYPLHDTERALAMLEQSLPVRVRRTLPWWVTIEARD